MDHDRVDTGWSERLPEHAVNRVEELLPWGVQFMAVLVKADDAAEVDDGRGLPAQVRRDSFAGRRPEIVDRFLSSSRRVLFPALNC